MLKKNKILLASGCSFTDSNFYSRDDSLPSDLRGGWPKWPELLANQLGLNCINKGQCGAGSDFILHSLIKGIYEYEGKIDTVAVLWSELDRLYIYNQHISPSVDLMAASDPDKDISKIHNRLNEKRKLNNDALYNIAEKMWNSSFFNWNVYYTMIDNWLNGIAILLDICLSKNIKIIMAQGVNPWSFSFSLKMAFRKNLIPRSSIISDNATLKYILSHPTFNFLEKNEKYLIGWPFFHQLGGYNLEHYSSFEKNYNWLDYHISKIDGHPNKLGHERYAKIYLEKYRELYD